MDLACDTNGPLVGSFDTTWGIFFPINWIWRQHSSLLLGGPVAVPNGEFAVKMAVGLLANPNGWNGVKWDICRIMSRHVGHLEWCSTLCTKIVYSLQQVQQCMTTLFYVVGFAGWHHALVLRQTPHHALNPGVMGRDVFNSAADTSRVLCPI